MKAHLAPALTTGVAPTIQLSVVEFTAIQLLSAGVAPFSNPPSPVGEIRVVCPQTPPLIPTKNSKAKNDF